MRPRLGSGLFFGSLGFAVVASPPIPKEPVFLKAPVCLKSRPATQRAQAETARTGATRKDQCNFTDPESHIMKNSTDEGFDQHYNVQAAVEQESWLIVANNRRRRFVYDGLFSPARHFLWHSSGVALSIR